MLLKVKLIDISPNLKISFFSCTSASFLERNLFFCGRFLGRVRVFLSEFFLVDVCVFSWTSACFLFSLFFFYKFPALEPWPNVVPHQKSHFGPLLT